MKPGQTLQYLYVAWHLHSYIRASCWSSSLSLLSDGNRQGCADQKTVKRGCLLKAQQEKVRRRVSNPRPHLHMAGESRADGKQNMPSVLSVHFQQFQRLQSAMPSLMLMACLPGFCEQKAQSCKVFRSIRGISLLCTFGASTQQVWDSCYTEAGYWSIRSCRW